MTRHRDEEEAEMAATTAQPMGSLPSGLGICTTAPDIFYLPELVFGGLVWILMALVPLNPVLAWVMFVSVFCFVVTMVWFFIFLCGANQSSVSPCRDVAYHFVAVVFYISASLFLTFNTILQCGLLSINSNLKCTGLEFAAMVMSYVATLLYFLHAIFSAIRCKRSKKTTRTPKEKKPNELLVVGLNTE